MQSAGVSLARIALLALAPLPVAFALGCGSCGGPTPRESAPTASPSEAAPPQPTTSAAPATPPLEAGAPDTPDAGIDAAPHADDAGAPAAEPEGMKRVPGGTFTMGADKGGEGDERPAHEVTLRPFFLDVTEVTQSAYEACVTAGKCRAASEAMVNAYGGLFKGPKKPIVGVSWFDARDYCAWAGKRLPREAEFERAVRGDDSRRYPWGNDAPTREHTVFSTSAPEEVGTHPKGRGPYGHDDLAGNVWEWMEDLYDPYAYRRSGAPKGEPGTCEEITAAQNELRQKGMQGFTGTNPIPNECERSIRGGAYNYPADGLRSTNRVHHPGTFRLKMTGFRCAKDAT